MREIKFRGKRKDTGVFVVGYYGELTDGEITKSFIIVNTLSFNPNKSLYFTDHEVDPETVGQFTGLHDKNGREIYEGDVLVANWYSYNEPIEGLTGIIDYFEGFGSFVIRDTEMRFLSDLSGKGAWCYEFEVVGNIYENPELLERA